jgi:5-methylcytosine-specific restriction endonuclease McrA
MKCGWSEINPKSGKVPIQLNHINGNSEDNKLSNLELLCPNCHSLTPTFGMLNKGNGRKKRRDRYQQEKLAA